MRRKNSRRACLAHRLNCRTVGAGELGSAASRLAIEWVSVRHHADCRMTSVPSSLTLGKIVRVCASASPRRARSVSTLLAVIDAKSCAMVVSGGQV